MSLPMIWKWLRILPLIILTFNHFALLPVRANTQIFDHPTTILKEHHEKIIRLSSDQEALEFYQEFMPKLRQPTRPLTGSKPSRKEKVSPSPPPGIQPIITKFLATLTTIATIQKLTSISQASLSKDLFSRKFLSDTQQLWISSKSSLKNVKDLIDLQSQLLVTADRQTKSFFPDQEYTQFANFHDHASSMSSNTAWTEILNARGVSGIEDKLQEYWQPKDLQQRQPIAESKKMAYIQEYIGSRLLPIFHTYILAHTLEVMAQAYEVAEESWQQIQQWNQNEETKLALRRLCGNWKWIIHNHQNHGDHKTTMTFHSPELKTPSHVQPTNILIHGDTVYLKWTFPQGIQEDSLLLSNHDSRLEGTFTNSLGPYGSISGQRLSSCQQ